MPAGAAIVLDFIASFEAPKGYDTVYGNKMSRMPKPLTTMTFDEVVAQGSWRTKNLGSSACGRYQFMRDTLDKPGTTADLKGELGLTGGEVFSADLQDRLGYHLLKRRGYAAFMGGTLNRSAFGLKIAQEWASFPVLVACQGAHRRVERGQSFYTGDSQNKALVRPEAVEGTLNRAYAAGNGPVPQTALTTQSPMVQAAPTVPSQPVRTVVQATGSGVRNGLSALWNGLRDALKKA